jgi:tetratricopeptide (TPR) repeat protein
MSSTVQYLLLAIPILLLVGGCESDLARQVSKYEKTRDYESARQLLERTVRKNPGNAEAQFLLGRLYIRQGSYKKGVSAFKKSHKSSARFVDKIDFLTEKYAHEEFKKGKQAVESGSMKDAIQHFRNVTRIQPSNAPAFRALGHARVQAKRFKEAEAAYEKALELEPTVETLNNLSSVTFRREAYSETIEYSRRALELLNQSEDQAPQGSKSEVVERLAYAYLQNGQFSDARKRFDQALQLDPSQELRRDYAFALHNNEEYEDALPHLQRLSAGEETTDSVLHALGETHLSLGRPQDAANTYLRLHERSPNDGDALQSLVIAYEELDQDTKAKEYFKKLKNISSEEE